MFIYLITIFILTVFVAIEINISDYFKKQTVSKVLLPIAWLLIVGQFAFRWKMATDWDNYYNFFNNDANWGAFYSGIQIFDNGFWIFNILAKSILDNFTFFLILFEGLFYILLFRFFKFSTAHVFLAILLYYALFMGYVGALRQLMAIALCLTGLKSLIEGHKLKFIGFVILGFYFHSSALLFLVYFFLNIKTPAILFFATAVACYLVGSSSIPITVFSSISGLSEHNASKVLAYTSGMEENMGETQVSTLGIIKKILFPSIFLLTREKVLKKYKHYNYLLNGYLVGVLFYFLFGKSLLVVVSRGSMYFNIMEPILLSMQLSIILNNKKQQSLIALGLCLLSVIFFFQSIKTYPDAFIPYRSIFNKTLD